MQRTLRFSYAACHPLLRPLPRRQLFSLFNTSTPPTTRLFTQSTCVNYPRKDAQDKDSIDTEATEYSKSGTDDASARHEDTAFDPGTTDPGEQKDKIGAKTGVSLAITL